MIIHIEFLIVVFDHQMSIDAVDLNYLKKKKEIITKKERYFQNKNSTCITN